MGLEFWPTYFWSDFWSIGFWQYGVPQPPAPPVWVLELSPAEIVNLLLNEGYINNLPDVNCDACTIFDTTPIDDGRLMKTGERCQHYGVQVGVRSQDYENGYLKMQDLSNTLNALHNVTVSQYRVHNAMKVSTGFVGVDEKRRNVFVSNFILTITKEN